MLQPAMVLVLAAYLGSFIVMRNPDNALAVGMSFFPTMTPFVMMLRMVMPPGPPMWQVILSIVILMGSTAGLIWAGGRIFRVGLLMQGKAPNLPELVKWIRL
jgi:ABC-2 type transport system permease protein